MMSQVLVTSGSFSFSVSFLFFYHSIFLSTTDEDKDKLPVDYPCLKLLDKTVDISYAY